MAKLKKFKTDKECTPSALSNNIKGGIHAGAPRRQAIAIALSIATRAGCKIKNMFRRAKKVA